MSNIALRRPSLPTTAAHELGAVHRRTRWLRLMLATAAIALLGGGYVARTHARRAAHQLLRRRRGGIIVLDLSSSVDRLKYQRVQRVLHTLADTEGRIGLVMFSDTAYEMFPPDTRTEEIRPLLKFFQPQFAATSHARRLVARHAERAAEPWDQSFRGGTKISTGLAEARRIIEREGNPNLQVMLLSDLDDSAFDTSALTEELIRYEGTGSTCASCRCSPPSTTGSCSSASSVESAFVQRDELLSNTLVRERQTVVGSFPWLLVGVRRRALPAARAERACLRAARLEDGLVTRRRKTVASLVVVRRVRVRDLLVVLAADILRWEREVRRADVRFASTGDTTVAWAPDPLASGGLAGAILAVDDDVDFREAVRRFWEPSRANASSGSPTSPAGAPPNGISPRSGGIHARAPRDRRKPPWRAAARGGEELPGPAIGVRPPRDRAVPPGVHARSQVPGRVYNLELAIETAEAVRGRAGRQRRLALAEPESGAGAATAGRGY